MVMRARDPTRKDVPNKNQQDTLTDKITHTHRPNTHATHTRTHTTQTHTRTYSYYMSQATNFKQALKGEGGVVDRMASDNDDKDACMKHEYHTRATYPIHEVGAAVYRVLRS